MSKKILLKHCHEIAVSLILALLLIYVINPGMLWMPSMLEKHIGILVLVLFIGFSIFFWREKPRDEREILHAAHAGRYAYFAGASVLMIGILYEFYTHYEVDIWLLISLAIMILTKTGIRIWNEFKK